MALAAGMKTAKLKYGNRGHNQVRIFRIGDNIHFCIFSHVY